MTFLLQSGLLITQPLWEEYYQECELLKANQTGTEHMYSPVRQVSQSPHSYKHDDNIYTSRSRHEHAKNTDIPPPIHKFNYKQVGPFRHKVTHKPVTTPPRPKVFGRNYTHTHAHTHILQNSLINDTYIYHCCYF